VLNYTNGKCCLLLHPGRDESITFLTSKTHSTDRRGKVGSQMKLYDRASRFVLNHWMHDGSLGNRPTKRNHRCIGDGRKGGRSAATIEAGAVPEPDSKEKDSLLNRNTVTQVGSHEA
jgi:hypothetical protein